MSTPLTFNDLHTQLYQLYEEKAYAQALELLQQEGDRFPERGRDAYYWRLCLTSRLDDVQRALQVFKDALALGYWFPPKWLRDDEDLKPLQGLPEYEQMVEACRQKLAAIQEHTKPELLVVPPERGVNGQAHPLLLALHSNGGNVSTSVDHWRSITGEGWVLALPQSAQVIGDDAYVWDDWEQATREVQTHFAALTKEHAIDPERVVVGGFSMGGGLAVWLAVSRAIKARGFVALGPYVPNAETLRPFLETAKADGVRGYIVMGELEGAMGRENVQKVIELLHAHDIPCELEWRPNIGHAYPADFEKSVEKALAFILQG